MSEQKEVSYTQASWCLQDQVPYWNLKPLCAEAKVQGITHIDLSSPDDWNTITSYDLSVGCALPCMGHKPNGEDFGPFEIGFGNADPATAERVTAAITASIDAAAAYGAIGNHDTPAVIVFTGVYNPDSDDRDYSTAREKARQHCIDRFPPIVRHADKQGVNLVLEMLNTRDTGDPWRSHPGYFGSNTSYCAGIVKEVNKATAFDVSQVRLKLVFDLYHMQMKDEDIRRMIELYGDLCGYVHAAGIYPPGQIPVRSELHLPKQVIDYPARLAQLMQIHRSMHVCLEYIPYEPNFAGANMGHAITYLEKWRDR